MNIEKYLCLTEEYFYLFLPIYSLMSFYEEKYCIRDLFTATKIPPEDLPDLSVLSFLGGLSAMISKPGITLTSM